MAMGQHGLPANPGDQTSGKSRCGCRDTVAGEQLDAERIAPLDGHGITPPDLPALTRTDHQVGIPFVVQAGSALFMLASDATVWTLAELRFDVASCTFVEARRARYDWPREAFGVMLSRAALSGEIEPALINRITIDFSIWLAQQFIGSHVE